MNEDQLIINNLQTLLEAVKAQPETLFDLSMYTQKQECGTLYCTAGLAATMPYFQAQGMEIKGNGHGGIFVYIGGGFITETERTAEMFGADPWDRLFATYGHGDFDSYFDPEYTDYLEDDDAYDAPEKAMSDKTLAIARLERQLAIYQNKGE